MKLGQMCTLALEQAALDVSDAEEQRPLLLTAANAAYDELVAVFRGGHVGSGEDEETPLRRDSDVPDVPEWCHRGICDYMTYCLLRMGGGNRPGRAQLFYSAWSTVLSRARLEGDPRFTHLPR